MDCFFNPVKRLTLTKQFIKGRFEKSIRRNNQSKSNDTETKRYYLINWSLLLLGKQNQIIWKPRFQGEKL